MNRDEGKIKNILFWKPDLRLIAAIFAVALILLLIPLLRIAFYAVPWYDGYNFGKVVKNFWDQEYSIKSALTGTVYCVKTEWYAWQGAYTATFFSSLMPAIWGEGYYFLGPLFIILFLPFSVFILVKTLLIDVLKVDKVSCIIVQCVAAILMTVLIYSPQEGFYWYVGGICYVGMHSFLMLLIAAWIGLLTAKRNFCSIILMICTLAGAALVAGATYVTTLQGLLIGCSIVALGMLWRNRRVWLLVPSLVVYGYGFYKSASAPGNSVRKAVLEEAGRGMDAIHAIINSFMEAFRHMEMFTGMMTVLLMILLLPVIWRMVRKLEFQFCYPGIFLLWSFCLYAAGFTPCLYSLGDAGPDRALNVIKLTYQALLLGNEIYWLGWFYGKLKKLEKITLFDWKWEKKEEVLATGKGTPAVFYLFMGIAILGVGIIEPDKTGSYSSYGAYYYVSSGEAYNFYQEYLERVETIKNGGDIVIVKPYHYTPEYLCMGDLSEDPGSGPNAAIAKWYDKQAIMLENE